MSAYIEFYKFSLPLVLTVNRCRIFHIFTYQGFYILTDAIYTRKYNTAELIKWMGLINLNDGIQWQRIHIPNCEKGVIGGNQSLCTQIVINFWKLSKNHSKFETYKFVTWYNVIKLWNNKSEVYFVYRILDLYKKPRQGVRYLNIYV